jgi:hypothetical protein
MRFLRRKIVVRCITVTMCIVILQSAIIPTKLWALSAGPAQMEYSSYETSSSTDMVNLLTGDFSYTMPTMNVPGPEGSFDIPLFYHGGIKSEDDASWVGLGWNMNVGSITRSISGYADDAYDNTVSVNVNDPGAWGYTKNYIFYTHSYNSLTGNSGSVGFLGLVGVSWDERGLKTGTLLGVEFNKSGSVHSLSHDLFQIGMSIMTIASFGAASIAEIAINVLETVGITVAGALYFGSIRSGTFTSTYNEWSSVVKRSLFRTDYKYYLDDTRNEKAFGALYMGSVNNSSAGSVRPGPEYNKLSTSTSPGTDWPRINDGSGNYDAMPFVRGFANPLYPDNVANDMFMYVPSGQNYSDVTGPSHVAYDNFNVMTETISGSMSPYRLDIGSMVQPKRVTFNNQSQNLVPFVQEDDDVNKVQFKYNGQFENAYTYHDDLTMGITNSVHTVGPRQYVYYDVSQAKLKTPANRIETDAARIRNKKIASGRNIEWYSNEQIVSGAAKNNGFMDTDLDIGRINTVYYPNKGIGGFSITNSSGVTYHYALPLYRSYEAELVGVKGQEETKYSKLKNSDRIAISWLLTGITGPDFVDRGTIGLLDDNDWGYWVKFNYGKTSAEFSYRAPYIGYADDGTSLRYSAGVRDEYYLNTAETRSHIAMFIKSPRNDGLSSYRRIHDQNYGHPTETEDGAQSYPVAPLKLDEIALLSKEDYQALVNLGFTKKRFPSDPASETTWRAYLGYVIDGADLDANQAYRTHISSKALKRVKFVYETNEANKLCKKTLNSVPDPSSPTLTDNADIYFNRSGKLTLKRVQTLGRNDVKVFPDVIFDYANNPDYNKEMWDGWGMYNSAGTTSTTTHGASSVATDASAWSLSMITTPLDARLSIAYEPDSYTSVSGYPVVGDLYTINYGNYTPTSQYDLKVSDATQFQVGNYVQVDGMVSYHCGTSSYPNNSYSSAYSVVGVNTTTNVLTLSGNYMNLNSCPVGQLYIDSNVGTIAKTYPSRNGGDIRVSSVTYSDNFGRANTTKYLYSDDAGTTTGVVTKEPDFIKGTGNPNNHGLDSRYDVPGTPVIYGKVSVLSNYDVPTVSFTEKNVFEFETPTPSIISETSTPIQNSVLPGFDYVSENGVLVTHNVSLKQYYNRIEDRASKIGKIKQITQRDKANAVISTTGFNYNENTPGNQGKFTSGSIMSEFTSTTGVNAPYVFKLLRTVKTQFPYNLTGITVTKDGYTSTIANRSWDFLTGAVLVKEATGKSGLKVRSETVPAYSISTYSDMGPMSLDPTHKNMLSQTAGEYTSLINASGAVMGLIDGKVSVWSNAGTNKFRVLSGGVYSDGEEPESVSHPKWRKQATYAFAGDYSRLYPETGLRSFGSSDVFNYGNSTHPGWILGSQNTKFNHYSMVLETVDKNNVYASTRLGYNDKYIILDAGNSRFGESTFSGAEDLNSSTGFFGGEVAMGSGGTVVSTPVHSGSGALQVSGNPGFVYKTQDLRANHTYRASAWCNSTNGRLYYKINGVETTSGVPVDQIGSWYRIILDIPVGATFPNFEVGVKSASGTVVFDDFRFNPSDARTTAYVYRGTSGQVEFELDDQNLLTKYEYNDAGVMIKVYRESFKYGGLKLVNENKYNYRRFYVNQ